MLWRVFGRWSTCRPPFQVTESLTDAVHQQAPSPWNLRHYGTTATAAIQRARPLQANSETLCLRQYEKELHDSRPRKFATLHAEAIRDVELFSELDETPDVGLLQNHVHQGTATWPRSASFLTDDVAVCRVAERLSRSHNPHQTLRLLEAAHAAGVCYGQNVYEQIAFYLAKAKRWCLVLSIVNCGIQKTGRTTTRLLNWRGKALLETQQFAQLNELLGDFEQYGLKPQRRTFHLLLKGHLLNHNVTQAKRTMIDMEGAGIPVDNSTYTTIVSAHRCLGSDKSTEEKTFALLMDAGPYRKIMLMNTLFRHHLDKHDFPGALRVLDIVGRSSKGRGHQFDESEGHVFGIIKPSTYVSVADCVTHSLLIEYLSKHEAHRVDQGLELLRCSLLPLDCQVAAALVRMYYLQGSETRALSVLLDACHSPSLRSMLCQELGYDGGLRPSSFSFQGEPTAELFNSVLNGSMAIHGIRIAPVILSLMRYVRVKPDSATLEILISYLKTRKLMSLNDFLCCLQGLISAELSPTRKQLNQVLSALVNFKIRGFRKDGWNALSYRVKSGRTFSRSTGLERDGPALLIGTDLGMVVHNSSTLVREVVGSLVESLESRGIMADRATFALRMRFDAYTLPPAQATEAASSTMLRMRELGLFPTIHHYAALIEAHCMANNFDAAYASIEDAASDGVLSAPFSHVKLYTIAISAYAQQGKASLALQVIQKMLRNGVPLDAAAVHAVVGAFFAVKAFRLARSLLLELWPIVAPFPEELRDAPLRILVAGLRKIRTSSNTNQGALSRSNSAGSQPTRSQVLEVIERITAMLGGKGMKSYSSRPRGFPLRREEFDGRRDMTKEVVTGSGEEVKDIQSPSTPIRPSERVPYGPTRSQSPKGGAMGPRKPTAPHANLVSVGFGQKVIAPRPTRKDTTMEGTGPRLNVDSAQDKHGLSEDRVDRESTLKQVNHC